MSIPLQFNFHQTCAEAAVEHDQREWCCGQQGSLLKAPPLELHPNAVKMASHNP